MIEIGSMVVVDGYTSRLLEIEGTTAHCVHIDRNGDFVRLSADMEDVIPLAMALSPQSMWPDSFNGGDEVRTRRTNHIKSERDSRKPRQSKKAKSH